MPAELRNLGAITMFISDIARSRAFYETVFGWTRLYQDDHAVGFDCGNAIVNLLLEEEAPGLIAPAPVAPQSAGARCQLTIWVEDVDAVASELAAKGVSLLSGPIDRPWGQRTVTFSDPDGHIWEIAQNIQEQ